MKRVFVFFNILLLSILSSCTKEDRDYLGNHELLDYNGSNIAGQLLISKITERDQGRKELDQIFSQYQRELLFDHTIFGQGFGFGIHYAVPVRNVKTGMVEGCVIYQVNKKSSENFDLKGKVDAPLFINTEKYKELSTSQKSYSLFFKKWKEQGLKVETELCMPDKSFSRTTTEKEQEIQASSAREDMFSVYIRYWIDLHGYIPPGASAYGIGFAKREEIFNQNSQILITSFFMYDLEIIVSMEDILITGSVGQGLDQNNFIRSLGNYLNACKNDFISSPGSPLVSFDVLSITGGGLGSGGGGGVGGDTGGGTGGGGGGGSSGQNPSGEVGWNESTHHKMIDDIAKQLNLSQEQIRKLKRANDSTDSVFEKNQFSRNAFLHAMNTDPNISTKEAREKFEKHLTETFQEYLRTGDYRLLGEALHGISDSFCPSHRGFQYYSWDFSSMMEHAKWDKGENSPLIRQGATDIMIDIVKILNNDQDPNRSGNALALWGAAYDYFINNYPRPQ